MLLKFRVKNYRSIRDEAVLDFEAASFSNDVDCFLSYGKKNYLPVISIHGKNGGGKSNLVRAFWLAVQFVRNSHRTQIENAEIPVTPFLFDDNSVKEPTEFVFEYAIDNIKYEYGFFADRKKVVKEFLYCFPKKQRAIIFEREGQAFFYPVNREKKIKAMISQAVAENQLFFAVACAMKYQPCIDAMRWFREQVVFSRDYDDFGQIIFDYNDDGNMLSIVADMARKADVGIIDMEFLFRNKEFSRLEDLPMDLPDEPKMAIRKAFDDFKKGLSQNAEGISNTLQLIELQATSFHNGIDENGCKKQYRLPLPEESAGTLSIMAKSIAIEEALRKNGVLIVDEIETRLHPLLVEHIIKKFQRQRKGNTAQLVFTTHSTDILQRKLLRRDQYYFVDKNSNTGRTEVYSLADFSPIASEKIGDAYILGKYGALPFIEED